MPKNQTFYPDIHFNLNVHKDKYFCLHINDLPLIFSIKESISDFYWYYSGKDVIDEPGKKNFSKAMTVAKQIFNSLTEYIQVKFGQIGH